MIRRVVIVALVVALCAGVLYGIVAGYEWWRSAVWADGERAGAARIQKLWDADRIDLLTRNADAVARARAEEQQAAAVAAQGEADARKRAEDVAAQQAAAARRSAAAADGVRDQVAALDAAARDAGVPDAAACPAAFAQQREHAIRARAVFGACVAEYHLLAKRAGRDRGDLQLRLDTALSYIQAIGAPGGP